jgi:hypothetical protein
VDNLVGSSSRTERAAGPEVILLSMAGTTVRLHYGTAVAGKKLRSP